MVPFIYTPREHHGARTPQDYAAKQAAFLAKKRRYGQRYLVHDSPGTLTARIDGGSWIVDCECGSANATDPAWGVAYCFACGAQHLSLVFPADPGQTAIVAALIERPKPQARGWQPPETAADLIAETARLGLGGRSS